MAAIPPSWSASNMVACKKCLEKAIQVIDDGYLDMSQDQRVVEEKRLSNPAENRISPAGE